VIDILRALAQENRTQVEAYLEGRSRAVPFGDHRLICRVLGTFFMLVDTRDLSLAPHLALSGYWEFWISVAMARRIKPGMRCIDVGANFGYFTVLLAALVGDKGFVQAWEPQRKVRECLESTLALNGFQDRVEVVPAAASSKAGEAVLWTPTHFWGSTRVVQDEDPKTEGERCELRTIDDSWLEVPPLDFIKIDAEGHEPEVWEGMSELRARSPKLQALIEFTPSCYADPSGFLKQLRAEGFRLSIVQTDGDLKPVEDAEILACERFEMLWLDSLT
jgi:FkbM family methyltransferase